MDGRFFKLSDNYALRGWDRLPYAYVDTKTNMPTFLHKDHASSLLLCDGEHDIDSILVSDAQRKDIEELVKRGVVVPCQEGEGLTEEQRYKFFPNRFVLNIQWSVTGRCNFACKHCMMSAPEGVLGELSHESALNIIEQLAECGVGRVALTGGELFARKDVPELTRALVAEGIVISQIYTNGSLLSESYLDLLAELGQTPEVVISFDGVGHHDWLRGIPGAEAMANRAIALAHERGLVTRVQMVAHCNNISSLRETVLHLADLGCTALRVGAVNELGDWVENGKGLTLTDEEFLEAELAYIPQYYEDGMPLPITLAGLVSLSPAKPDRYVVNPYKGGQGCDACLLSCARNSFSISADGVLSVCELSRPLRDSSLVELHPIVSDDPSVHTVPLRESLSGDSELLGALYLKESDLAAGGQDCAACKYLSACKGGCRAQAFQSSGSMLGPDPSACTFFKKGWAERLIQVMHEVRPEATSDILEDPLFVSARISG